MSDRLPAKLEVQGLLRQVQAAGGFATVLHRGEADAGALIVVTTGPREAPRAWERMPSPDGGRVWIESIRVDALAGAGNAIDSQQFAQWLERRSQQDPDLWIIELDIPQAERFIGQTGAAG